MIRRQHKKSRKGCAECKRRHIRCDEQHPTCINCTKAERVCSYSIDYKRHTEEYQHLPPHQPDVTESPCNNGPTQHQQEISCDTLNMLHLELLMHFNFDIYVPEFDQKIKEPATKLVLQTALKAPFLMHEILAISAFHLSVIRPSEAVRYRSQAMELQTKAIELFNIASRVADREDTRARLLFSSILGRHIIADALDTNGFDFSSFLHHYVHGIRIYRGVRAVVAEEEWNVLLGSELGPLITQGLSVDAYKTLVELDDTLWKPIFHSTSLDADEKTSCEAALRLIETGFRNLKDLTKIETGRRMIFLWSVMVPDLFVDLLARQTPEAIAILGRYAILLHHGRSLWQIGEAGPRLFRVVLSVLGPAWEEWLSWPEGLQIPKSVSAESSQQN